MSNAVIAWAVRPPVDSPKIRVTVGATTTDVAVSAVSTSDYYTVGDGQSDDLLAKVQAAIQSHSGITTCTVVLTAGWRVQITTDASAVIEWGAAETTLTPGLIGFAAETPGLIGFGAETPRPASTTVTGTLAPWGLWRPGRPVSYPDSRERRQFIGGHSVSMSGKVRVSDFGEIAARRSMSFPLLQPPVALAEFSPDGPGQTFEYAWHESMRLGRPWRLYEDESDLTTDAYRTYRVAALGDPLDYDQQTPTRWAVSLEGINAD